MMHCLTLFLAYCESHPAAVTLVVGALVSCFYQKLDKFPRVHAFLSVLVQAGVNVPGVISAISRLVTSQAAKVATVTVLVFLPFAAGCAGLTPKDKTDVATYAAQQGACVAANPKDKAAIDACRAAVRAKWCAQWAAEFDASVCEVRPAPAPALPSVVVSMMAADADGNPYDVEASAEAAETGPEMDAGVEADAANSEGGDL